MSTVDADLVECSVVQQALTDSGITVSELARRLDYFEVKPDFQKVARRMGLTSHAGVRKPAQKRMGYERAVEFIRAMNLDPTDYGL